VFKLKLTFVPTLVLGVVAGGLARLYMLRIDYRQYPSYPQGYTIHLALGFIAAFLGSVAVPAILTEDFAAATFLALAATQFREVRDTVRQTLSNMEATELVPRGTAYIEGIARVFEARNYLAMLTALIVSISFELSRALSTVTVAVVAAVSAGLGAMYVLNRAMVGQEIRDIANVREGRLHFEGALLLVDDIVIMNIGLKSARRKVEEEGVGIVLEPKGPRGKSILTNAGQRQAILHDMATLLGVRLDIGEPEFTPLARRNLDNGNIGIALVPAEKNVEAAIAAAQRVPVLEGARRKPLASVAGRMVD